MHSVFRLPWSSEPVGDRFAKPYNGVVELPFVNKLKRKLADTANPSPAQSQRRMHPHKKSKPTLPSSQNTHTPSHPANSLGNAVLLPVQVAHCQQPFYAAVEPSKPDAPVGQPVQPQGMRQPQLMQQAPRSAEVPVRLSSEDAPPSPQSSVPRNFSDVSPTQSEQPKKASLSVPASLTPTPAPLNGGSPSSKAVVEDKAKVAATDRGASLREIIESHFNYEILLKHREVQLIEQELAKCQISLEQLRRCQLVPYPGVLAMSEEVSNGVGPAIRARQGFSQPECPPPWGVTDGPYARHYAKWLIPDARFDAMSKEDEAAHAKNLRQSTFEGRATRATNGELSAGISSATSGKARLSRTSAGNRPYASGLDSPPLSRDRQVPLLVKRSTDGQYVKLVCNDCRRGNFSSAQGFLNHCRIAHHRDYKSHDAAAVACGQPVKGEELSSMTAQSKERQGQGQTQENDIPAKQLSSTQVSQFQLQSPSNDAVPPVHSLIRENMPSSSPGDALATTYKLPPRKFDFANASGQSHVTHDHAPGSASASKTFVSSPETPHLSALLRERGFNGNLQTMVKESRESIDEASAVEWCSADDSEAAVKPAASATENAQPGSAQSGLKARMAERRSKPLRLSKDAKVDASVNDGISARVASAFVTCLPLASSTSDITPDQASTSTFLPDMDYSPNTADSSNPGLVSDRDDDFPDDDELEIEEESAAPFRPAGHSKGFKNGGKLDANMVGSVQASQAPPAVRVACFSGNQHDDAVEEDLDIGAVKFAAKSK